MKVTQKVFPSNRTPTAADCDVQPSWSYMHLRWSVEFCQPTLIARIAWVDQYGQVSPVSDAKYVGVVIVKARA